MKVDGYDSLSVDLRVEWSCTEMTEVMISEAFFLRALRLEQRQFASIWRTPTHGRRRRDELECRFSGPAKTQRGEDSWLWLTQMVAPLHWQKMITA
jgi:hypothetical protein